MTPTKLRTTALRPARLRALDVARVGGFGLRTRPLRAFLSALGIAIGIAAMVAVVGISASSRAGLDEKLARISTNLLTVAPGKDLSGNQATLPDDAVPMVTRINGVTSVSATAMINAAVYRNDHVPSEQTNGIGVLGVRTDLLAPVGSQVTSGVWFNAGTAHGPTVVLGATAARDLGIRELGPDIRVWLGDQRFTVIGILGQTPLAPELDTAALVGWIGAERYLGFDGKATNIYVRIRQDSVAAVHGLLSRTVNPEFPNEVNVERPSDALTVKEATDQTFTGLLLGLGGVALLVGGVGVANTMIISVLERRAEIGLRRALGATRSQIRTQFLTESLLLCALGGVGGVLLGAGVTKGYAQSQGWPTALPAWLSVAGVTSTLVIGMVAGLYPSVRAARLAPTEALGS